MTPSPSAKHLASVAFLIFAGPLFAQSAQSAPSAPVPGERASAYYHDGLAHLYEELAVNNGRADYAAQAIEEYKLALNADPQSKYLQDGLADLYFKLGRIREAVTTAQEQVKKDPSNLQAHTLLGKVYLRSLNDMQGPQAQEMLQLAMAEYEKISQLKPDDLESHLILGQLYNLNHDSAKAEAELKRARSLDSNSEDAVLSMARLYTEQGEPQRAVDVLTGIPAADRSARISAALGAGYDQMHKSKLAAEAYRAAVEEDPENPETQRSLAAALMADNQLAEAQKVLEEIVRLDASDVQSQVHLSEAQRRQGHYDAALATLRKAKAGNGATENLELAFNEAVLYDSLGRYDDSIKALRGVLASTVTPDGVYTDGQKSNRAIFLDRLGIVLREQGKTTEAVAAYKEMVALGGDFVGRGYQGEVDSYRDAHQWKEAVNAAAAAALALPKDKSVQLMYAFQLADTGQPEKSLTVARAQLTNGPDDRDTLVALGTIEFHLGRNQDALAELAKAEKIMTKQDDKTFVSLLRAQILDHDKQFAAAEAEYRKVLASDPNNAAALNDLGYMLADRGVQLNDALAMIKRAVAYEPQMGEYLDSLGWVEYKLGHYGPAEESLKKAIDRRASDPSIHDHLGEVYEKTGRLRQAVDQWERAMTEYAHSLPSEADPADIARVKRKLEQARTKLARVGPAASKKS